VSAQTRVPAYHAGTADPVFDTDGSNRLVALDTLSVGLDAHGRRQQQALGTSRTRIRPASREPVPPVPCAASLLPDMLPLMPGAVGRLIVEPRLRHGFAHGTGTVVLVICSKTRRSR
jgi:hypothetical protein